MNAFMSSEESESDLLPCSTYQKTQKKCAAVSLKENIRGMFPLEEAWFPLVYFCKGSTCLCTENLQENLSPSQTFKTKSNN